MEAQREATSWVALQSDGGRLFGMVSNWKLGKLSKEFGPLDSKKHWWLNSVLWAQRFSPEGKGGKPQLSGPGWRKDGFAT